MRQSIIELQREWRTPTGAPIRWRDRNVVNAIVNQAIVDSRNAEMCASAQAEGKGFAGMEEVRRARLGKERNFKPA